MIDWLIDWLNGYTGMELYVDITSSVFLVLSIILVLVLVLRWHFRFRCRFSFGSIFVLVLRVRTQALPINIINQFVRTY